MKIDPHKAQRGADKVARIPVKIIPTEGKLPRKPAWIRAKAPTDPNVLRIKKLIKEKKLNTVCEEASCPNLGECFAHGTATFMIMGELCTRRCPFCDVAHGRPQALDENEPQNLADAIQTMGLSYVVVTSVDRDDLRDGGGEHFANCINKIRKYNSTIKIEILVPDFRGRMKKALDNLEQGLPDVFNHNLETIPRLYKQVRPGADYQWSLDLIKEFKNRHPTIPTKSGLMLGLGETLDEVKNVLQDLKDHGCNMITLGQYLQPTRHHLPVERFVPPEEFGQLKDFGIELGFDNIASAPMVRSSYHADLQAGQQSNQSSRQGFSQNSVQP